MCLPHLFFHYGIKNEVISINHSNFGRISRKVLNSKPYRDLNKIIILTWVLFSFVYIFRDSLYNLNNSYITLFAGVAPNLLSSFLFTLIGMFYILPYFKSIDSINRPIFIWLVNLLNLIVFLLIEYGHVILNLGYWDNNDLVASVIGLLFSTIVYLKLRKRIFNAKNM